MPSGYDASQLTEVGMNTKQCIPSNRSLEVQSEWTALKSSPGEERDRTRVIGRG